MDASKSDLANAPEAIEYGTKLFVGEVADKVPACRIAAIMLRRIVRFSEKGAVNSLYVRRIS